MKNNMIKRTAAFAAAALIVISGMYSVYAEKIPSASERSGSKTESVQSEKPSASPQASESDTKKSSTDDGDDAQSTQSSSKKSTKSSTEDTSKTVQVPVTAATTADMGRYVTKLGAFGWFILSVLVNLIISFAVGYRFYRMGRRDNHVIAEMRAIKKDIDAKMQASIGGFSEYETKVTNKNRSYAQPDTNIKSSYTPEEDEASKEIYKKWEAQLGGDIKSEDAEQSGEAENGRGPDAEEVARRFEIQERAARIEQRRKTSKPERRSSADEDKGGVMDKIKGFIGNIMPLDDEDE